MSLDGYIKWVRRILPSPFAIAIILTLVSFLLVLIFHKETGENSDTALPLRILEWWQQGMWNSSLMVFAMQMMLILVLGHVLARAPAVDQALSKMLVWCTNTSRAAFLVTVVSLTTSLFNWGLGLIIGAVFARKIGEQAARNQQVMNYPLIGAAGYSGLMIWHCGLSGSALIKVAEPGHLSQLMQGSLVQDAVPDTISMGSTFLSSMNITTMVVSVVLLPILMFFLGGIAKGEVPKLKIERASEDSNDPLLIGAERIDHNKWISSSIGFLLLAYTLYMMFSGRDLIDFFTPNNINFMLLSLCLLLHKNFKSFISSVEEAIGGASGILIQFPLYFGIMGMMNQSGLISQLADVFVNISNETTFPLFTFISAGIVNFFVPSGGGQWAVQGPLIIESAMALDVSLPKSVLALAYGDQITNMLQPFWALPLLGITKLSARNILPYTLFLFLAGIVIYGSMLLLF